MLLKGKTEGCSYGKMTASGSVESFQLKQWEEGQMEREDQRKSKVWVSVSLCGGCSLRIPPSKPFPDHVVLLLDDFACFIMLQ